MQSIKIEQQREHNTTTPENISQQQLLASANKLQKSETNYTRQQHSIQKCQSTHPKNARKIYVGCLDPNINDDGI